MEDEGRPSMGSGVKIPVARKWVSPRRMLEREDGSLGRFPLRIRGFNTCDRKGRTKEGICYDKIACFVYNCL